MIILDTNVISELMRPEPAIHVVSWLDRQQADQVYLTSITVAELLFGVARLPEGRRRRRLVTSIATVVDHEFAGRIKAFDAESAVDYAAIVAHRERIGRPISMADAQIAAICRLHGASLSTRNTGDFIGAGIVTVNPWDSPPD